MRLFYNRYKKFQPVSGKCQTLAVKLSWSHYCYLIYIDDDNETIGIILCTGKKGITIEYALGGLSNKVFAQTYTYYIPNREELINEVEKVINIKINNKK